MVQLFTGVSPSVWAKRTFLIFYHLLDNYERATGVQENTSQREHKEQWDFLQACMQTRPMQYCFRYLVAKVRLFLLSASDRSIYLSINFPANFLHNPGLRTLHVVLRT